MNFFDKLTGKDKNKSGGGGGGGGESMKNPFARASHRKFGGTGQSLGGVQPGKVFQVSLVDSGPLGIQIEKRPNSQGTAIVATVVPGGQADQAGLIRGDILCYADSNGQDEIKYNEFLHLAKSGMRPMTMDVRRITTKSTTGAGGAAAAAGGGGGPRNSATADAYARKQAVIAAAEARERASKAKNKTSGGSKGDKLGPKKENFVVYDNQFSETPMSEEAKKAVEAAKRGEDQWAAQLGYNPYETNKVTAGQARTATTAVAHGTMQGGAGGGGLAPPGSVAPPPRATTAADSGGGNSGSSSSGLPVSDAFEDAYTTLVTTNEHAAVVSSLGIMRKLMVNATTKGQRTDDEEAAAKFRKVRLSNPKIRAAISDVDGALDLMMSVGFELAVDESNDGDGEQEENCFLVFPPGETGPSWLSTGLDRMQKYAES